MTNKFNIKNRVLYIVSLILFASNALANLNDDICLAASQITNQVAIDHGSIVYGECPWFGACRDVSYPPEVIKQDCNVEEINEYRTTIILDHLYVTYEEDRYITFNEPVQCYIAADVMNKWECFIKNKLYEIEATMPRYTQDDAEALLGAFEGILNSN